MFICAPAHVLVLLGASRSTSAHWALSEHLHLIGLYF